MNCGGKAGTIAAKGHLRMIDVEAKEKIQRQIKKLQQ